MKTVKFPQSINFFLATILSLSLFSCKKDKAEKDNEISIFAVWQAQTEKIQIYRNGQLIVDRTDNVEDYELNFHFGRDGILHYYTAGVSIKFNYTYNAASKALNVVPLIDDDTKLEISLKEITDSKLVLIVREIDPTSTSVTEFTCTKDVDLSGKLD